MIWEHPLIGALLPMSANVQPGKVWRHLHSPTEGWSEIVGTDTQRLRSAARTWGCPDWHAAGEYPRFRPDCASRLCEQHDRHWVAAYGRLLLDPEARCARSRRDGRWIILAPQGVYAVVARGTPARVLSVYRPQAPGLNVPPSDGDFLYFAERKWSRETGMSTSTLLSELSRRATDPVAVWRLARALGDAEGITSPPVAEASTEAARWLEGLAPDVRAAAIPDRALLLDALEAAVREDDADVSGALLELEDAVVVTRVLAGSAACDELVEALGALLDWCPASWSRLHALPTERVAEGPVMARALWERIGDAIQAASLQEVPAAHRPLATLAASLVAPPWWEEWSRAIGKVRSIAVEWLTAPEAGWAAAPARMSQAGGAWNVVPPASLVPKGARVFVVHAGAPGGEEITADLAIGEPVWELDHPGEEIRVVVVEGVPTGTLAEAVEAAGRTDAVRLTVVEISRPR